MKSRVTGIFCGVMLIAILLLNAFYPTANKNAVTVDSYTPNTTENTVELPVIMYHHLMPETSRIGDYVILPDELEADLKYIQDNGFTTVTCEEILDYCQNNTPLPKKPILLTFDDGYETVHEYAYPLLQKYDAKAVVAILGKYTDLYSGDVVKGLSYSHLTWDQIREMLGSGLIELGNHTYDMHKNEAGVRKGALRLESETEEQYEQVMRDDVLAFNEEIQKETGITPIVFAYPFGAISKGSDFILSDFGFKIALTCEERVNLLPKGGYTSADLLKLSRYNRASGRSVESILSKVLNKK